MLMNKSESYFRERGGEPTLDEFSRDIWPLLSELGMPESTLARYVTRSIITQGSGCIYLHFRDVRNALAKSGLFVRDEQILKWGNKYYSRGNMLTRNDL